jgi:S1-C subfamily serine protease
MQPDPAQSRRPPRWLPPLALLGLALSAGRGAAEDSLPLDTLARLKAATVFLKVGSGEEAASGSGFVVAVDGPTVYVVTNDHVLDLRPDPRPGERRPPRVTPKVTAVFGSGTADEQSVRAEVLASAPRSDLAVLAVRGLKSPPRPVDVSQQPKLVETMPVYVFGFPLGELLATSKRSPAITVGKGSVSSIRLTDSGDLATVQIDGDITPGNSGGPVVDAQGRLVGVAAATIRGRRIGFAIPATTLGRLLQGQLLDYQLTTRRVDGGTVEVRVALGVFDPMNRLRGVSFYYLPQEAPGSKKLSAVSGVQKVELAREGQQMVGRFNLAAAEGRDTPLTFQAAWQSGGGTTWFSNPAVRRVR